MDNEVPLGAQSAAPREFTCHGEGCGERFSEPSELAIHMRTAHRPRGVICQGEGCGKRFFERSKLSKHIRDEHEGDEYIPLNPLRFACKVTGCEMTFVQPGGLTRHTRAMHEGVREFPCEAAGCAMAFSQKANRDNHMRSVHGGLRDFACGVPGCDKTFSQGGHVKRHRRAVHENRQDFACQVIGCSSRFSRKAHREDHMRRGAHKMSRRAGRPVLVPNVLVNPVPVCQPSSALDVGRGVSPVPEPFWADVLRGPETNPTPSLAPGDLFSQASPQELSKKRDSPDSASQEDPGASGSSGLPDSEP